MAKRLRIGLQLGNLDSGSKIEIFNEIDQICQKRNFDLYLIPYQHNSYNSIEDKFNNICPPLFANSLDVIIGQPMIGADQSMDISLLERKQDKTSIYSDVSLYPQLIEHLCDVHNCRTFNIICGPKQSFTSGDRLNCIVNVLALRGIDIQNNRIYHGSFTEDSGYGAMVYFLSEHVLDCDCIIALNDDMAVGALRFCKKRNIRVPEDIKIIGFDNTNLGKYQDISLTTIGEDIKSLCLNACKRAEYCKKDSLTNNDTGLKGIIKYRKSCGCVSKQDYKTDYISETGKKKLLSYKDLVEYNNYATTKNHDLFVLRPLLTALGQAKDFDSAIKVLKDNIRCLQLRSLYVVAFDKLLDGKTIVDKAKILLSYDETRFKSHDNKTDALVSFNPQEEIIPDINIDNRQHTYIIKPLYKTQGVYGYIVYQKGCLSSVLYDSVFNLLSDF